MSTMKRDAQFSDGSFIVGAVGGMFIGATLVGATVFVSGAALINSVASAAESVLAPFKPKSEDDKEDRTNVDNASR